jgi:poly(hydroxyalkanoate) granule-associated protein
MTAKKKAKELQKDFMDSAHRIWLAGLGAVAVAEEEGTKLFTNLVERGEGLEEKSKEQVEKAMGAVTGVKTVAESYWETFESTVDDQVTGIIHRLGVPTKTEIDELSKQVEKLSKSIDAMKKEAKPAAKPATRRTTTRKTPAKTTKAEAETK